MEDGSRDYPINVDGRQTLTGYQVRVWGAGNIVASPSVNGHLYLVFSDNRNGTHDVDDPVTNSDVFVVTSANRGDTWTAPSLVDTGAGDQWFPGDPSCEFCAVFHGDYIGLAYGRDGHANAIWTDMRDPSPFTQGLFLQFI